MRKIILSLLITLLMFSLSGCIGAGYDLAPSSKKEVSQDITIKYDKFKKQTWIRTHFYLIGNAFTNNFPVMASYRALAKDNKLEFIQLYLKINGREWAFFNQAVGEDGYHFEFLKIDDDINVISGGGQAMAIVQEHVALSVPIKQLKKMASKDYEIKIYGKRREGSFIMPKIISSAFYQKLQNINK